VNYLKSLSIIVICLVTAGVFISCAGTPGRARNSNSSGPGKPPPIAPREAIDDAEKDRFLRKIREFNRKLVRHDLGDFAPGADEPTLRGDQLDNGFIHEREFDARDFDEIDAINRDPATGIVREFDDRRPIHSGDSAFSAPDGFRIRDEGSIRRPPAEEEP